MILTIWPFHLRATIGAIARESATRLSEAVGNEVCEILGVPTARSLLAPPSVRSILHVRILPRG
jgi:hypothetical protein